MCGGMAMPAAHPSQMPCVVRALCCCSRNASTVNHPSSARTRRHHAHITTSDSRYSIRRKARYVIETITVATATVNADSSQASPKRSGVRAAPKSRCGRSRISSIQMMATISRKPAPSSSKVRRNTTLRSVTSLPRTMKSTPDSAQGMDVQRWAPGGNIGLQEWNAQR